MKLWLDRITGRVTMYRLVAIVLGAIAAVALVESIVGTIGNTPLQFVSSTPLEILASLAVSVGAAVASSAAFGFVFRVKPHLESSIITGLIVFFLFFPSTDPRALGGTALAAVIAGLSKYVFAIRRRHIVNPAAIGAVVVTLLGVSATAWWVATPGLLAVTAIGAALVLYRTRRLPLGLLFIAISLALVTARLAAGGYDPVEAFTTALTSYPIVFLAGFMLSEPLTLPPRRWQQLALAVVVAVLFSLPFGIGTVFMTPELALVIGNILAFLAGQRRGIRLTYLGSRPLARGIREFAFEPASVVTFAAGQYMELSLPHAKADSRGERRVFSIASAPGDTNRIAFGLRVPERSSSLKSALSSLSPGDLVSATSVGGDFVLPKDAAKPVALVAGGIGITPFVSQLAHDRGSGTARDSVLVYAVPDADDVAYGDLLATCDVGVLLVAPHAPQALPAGWRYLGPSPLTSEMLQAAIPDLAARSAFVSGPPALVDDARRVLRSAGVRRIATDYFTGY